MTTAKLTAATAEFIEVDYREGDGIAVALLWNRPTNRVSIYVVDARTGESAEFAVSPMDAREAFTHPFSFIDASAKCSILSGVCLPHLPPSPRSTERGLQGPDVSQASVKTTSNPPVATPREGR